MQRGYTGPRGQSERLVWNASQLAGNMLGEPLEREVIVWTPLGFQPGQKLPLLVELASYGNSGASADNWVSDRENRIERLDRLVGSGQMAPAVVVFFDSWTRLGGNQHVNSPVTGHWSDAVQNGLVPLIESKFGCGGPGLRGVFGKSSGGYGALMQAMQPDSIWNGVACLSGDMDFDLCYRAEWPRALTHLARWDYDPARFLADYEKNNKPSSADRNVISQLCHAASYDPDPKSPLGLRLPFDPKTMEPIEGRWRNWRRFDPLNAVVAGADRLRQLKSLWIEAGSYDEYNLQYGARRLTAKLTELGVKHGFEEFPDGHLNLDYRLDGALIRLAQALKSPAPAPAKHP